MGNPKESSLFTGAGTPWGGGAGRTSWNPMESALGTGAGTPWSAGNENTFLSYGMAPFTGGASLDLGGQERTNQGRDFNIASDQAAFDVAERQRGEAERQRQAREKSSQDYVTSFGKRQADEAAMKALSDARAASRKSTGRQINFF
jgi:hypothetical protein